MRINRELIGFVYVAGGTLLLSSEREQILLVGLLPGILSGFVFWWIAIKERRNEAGVELE